MSDFCNIPMARMRWINTTMTEELDRSRQRAAEMRETIQDFCDKWGLDPTGLAIAHRILRKAVGEHANPAKARAIYDTMVFALSKQGWDFDAICPPSLFPVDNVERLGDHRETEEVA